LQQLDILEDAAIAILINLINIPPDAVGNNSRAGEFPPESADDQSGDCLFRRRWLANAPQGNSLDSSPSTEVHLANDGIPLRGGHIFGIYLQAISFSNSPSGTCP